MKLFDAHCHYEDARFDEDRDVLLNSLPSKNVSAVVDAGCSLKDSIYLYDLSRKFSFMYFCAGIHPENAAMPTEEEKQQLEALWQDEKCVAVGEIGLDLHWPENPPLEIQKEVFLYQIDASKRLHKPAVIHTRDAMGEMIELLKSENVTGCLMHCYPGSVETARELLNRGMYFSFGGTSTFKNARKSTENLLFLPRERVLLETDCPYLAPEPVRGRRNDSSNLAYVAEYIASLWQCTAEEVAQITYRNACRFYGLKIGE